MLGIEFYPYQGTLNAVTGSVSVTIVPPGDAMIAQIYIESATASTTFDLSITDRFSLKTWEETDITGFMTEITNWPAYGNFTLAIANASADEAFKYLVVLQTRN